MKASHRRAKLAARQRDFDNLTGSQWSAQPDGSKRKPGGDGAKHTWHRPGSQK